MKICPTCGQQSPDDTVFCPNCGQRVPEQPAPQPAPAKTGGFCPNCGAPQPAGSAFCTNCGSSLAAPAQAQQAPAPARPRAAPAKKGGGAKKALIAVVAVVLVAAIGVGGYLLASHLGGGSGVGLFASEEEWFVGYQQAVLADPMMDAVELMLDTYSGGISTDLTISASVKGNDQIQSFLKDTAIRLSLEAGGDSFLANAELVLMGSPVISGLVTYDSGTAGFYLPQLDTNYYTADLTRMAEILFGMDLDIGDTVLPNISGKDLRALAEGYLDIVTGIVSQDNLTVEKNQSFRLSQLRESCTGTVYTFKPRPKDVEKLILDLAEHLEKDKQLRQLLLEMFDSGLFAALFTSPGFDLEDALDGAIAELVDELEDSAADIADWVEDTDLTWMLYMEGQEVRMITITVDAGRGNMGIIAYERAGSKAKGLTEAFYTMEKYNGGEDENVLFLLESSRTITGSTLTGKLEYTVYPDTEWEYTICLKHEIDVSRISPLGIPYGSYELSFPAGFEREGAISLEVTQAGGGSTDHVITIRNLIRLLYDDSGTKDIKITINATDKCSAKAPSDKAVDISDYSPIELAGLFQNLQSEAQNLFSSGVLYDLQRAINGSGSDMGAYLP